MKLFTDSHEWIEVQGEEGWVGVTEYAQQELGEIVFIELPEVGREVRAGEETVVLESTKAAADIYAPVTGVITRVNDQVKHSPDLLNRAPEGEGWLYKITLTQPEELAQLISREAYEKLTEPS